MQECTRRAVIGVMGGADPNTPDKTMKEAEEAGRLIAEAGAVLLCGGRSGVMEAAARGAKSVTSGQTLAILPGPDPDKANRYMDIVVATGMGNARNVINVLTSDAIIAFAGGAGTLSEIALALKNDIHVIGCSAWKLDCKEMRPLEQYYHHAESAREAVELAVRFARKAIPGPERGKKRK